MLGYVLHAVDTSAFICSTVQQREGRRVMPASRVTRGFISAIQSAMPQREKGALWAHITSCSFVAVWVPFVLLQRCGCRNWFSTQSATVEIGCGVRVQSKGYTSFYALKENGRLYRLILIFKLKTDCYTILEIT